MIRLLNLVYINFIRCSIADNDDVDDVEGFVAGPKVGRASSRIRHSDFSSSSLLSRWELLSSQLRELKL